MSQTDEEFQEQLRDARIAQAGEFFDALPPIPENVTQVVMGFTYDDGQTLIQILTRGTEPKASE